jgi:PAS domain S-box-containing protein
MEGIILSVNPALERITGLEREKIVGTDGALLASMTVKPADLRQVLEALESVKGETEIPPMFTTLVGEDGQETPICFTTSLLTDESGRPAQIMTTIKDITDITRAEESDRRRGAVLAAINRVFRETLTCQTAEEVAETCLEVAMHLTDSRLGWIGEMSPAGQLHILAKKFPGWAPEALPSGDSGQMMREMQFRGIWHRVVKKQNSLIINSPSIFADRLGLPEGHPSLSSFLCIPLKDRGGLRGLIVLANKAQGYGEADRGDVETLSVAFVEALNRKRAEQALRASEERFRAIVESTTDCILVWDREYNYLYANQASIEHVGTTRDKVIGRNIRDGLGHIPDFMRLWMSRVDRVFETGEPMHAEDTIPIGDRLVTSESTISPIRDMEENIFAVGVVYRDVTKRKTLEEDLLKAQKLESIGILAGGIAHDFNNILTALLGNITLAKRHAKPEDAVHERLTEAEKAALGAKELTHQLLTFSKGGTPLRSIASMASIIKDTAVLASRGSNVRCEFSLPDDLWPVEVDEGQISQAFHNLTINAIEAMPEGGTVQIRAQNAILGANDIPSLSEGNYLKIAIQDYGAGIPKEFHQKVFDPYFTTKEKGTGLGLSTTYSIIKKHGGYISMESDEGMGTTFTLFLPASDKPFSPEEEKVEIPLMGEGKILLMDDDPLVLDVAGRLLADAGYEVAFAQDGEEAIALYEKAKESDQPFHAVILDLTIQGGMGGKEAIKRLRQLDPEVRAIVSSGYSNDPVMASFREYGFHGVVAKPYTIEQLCEQLHRILTDAAD